MPGTSGNHALRAELGSKRVADPLKRFGMVAGSNERADARVTQQVKGRSSFAWQPPTVCATNTPRDVFREWSIIDVRCSREPQELAQGRWVGAEALAEHDIAEALEVGDLWVVRDQVPERRFDQRQGTHLLRPACRCEKRPQHSIGVREDVRARIEQRNEIGCVNLEVVTAWRTGRITAPVHEREGPSGAQWPESRPRRGWTCPTVNQQHFRAMAPAHHSDVIRPGHLAHTYSRRLVDVWVFASLNDIASSHGSLPASPAAGPTLCAGRLDARDRRWRPSTGDIGFRNPVSGQLPELRADARAIAQAITTRVRA